MTSGLLIKKAFWPQIHWKCFDDSVYIQQNAYFWAAGGDVSARHITSLCFSLWLSLESGCGSSPRLADHVKGWEILFGGAVL